ncbi:MAG: hypothetical protein JW837_07225 [Sedimentisphaerales bacterium]|nr:hypothetical protein [Sedimentisphaerales bacterium]
MDYSESDIDFKAKGKSVPATCNITAGDLLGIRSEKQHIALGDVEIRKTCAVFGDGITDNMEAFVNVRAMESDRRF